MGAVDLLIKDKIYKVMSVGIRYPYTFNNLSFSHYEQKTCATLGISPLDNISVQLTTNYYPSENIVFKLHKGINIGRMCRISLCNPSLFTLVISDWSMSSPIKSWMGPFPHTSRHFFSVHLNMFKMKPCSIDQGLQSMDTRQLRYHQNKDNTNSNKIVSLILKYSI